jgi:phosphotransferase system HPr-like phosphotransfer protein
MLASSKGKDVTVVTSGPAAEKALSAVIELIASGFEEN